MRRGMSLSQDQLQTLQTFQEISQITDDSLSLQILQANRWNLEASLSQFVGQEDTSIDGDDDPYGHGLAVMGSGVGGRSATSSSGSNNNNIPDDSPTSASQTYQQQQQLGTTIGTNANRNESGSILDLLFIPLRWLFQAKSISLNPTRDAQKFIAEFSASFGVSGPRFHDNSYQSAVATAFQESKFLLVYLHSPLHDDTDKFCSQVLCSPQFVEFANQNVVLWGGKVFDAEAYGLSSQLGVSAFPFVALLLCQSARVAQIVDRVQGFHDTASLVLRLQNATEQYSTVLERNRMETHQRREAQRLRDQQDREYQESLNAEREEMERREREERERIELEESRQQEQELAAAVEMSKKLSRGDTLRKLKQSFEVFPQPEKIPDAATVRFQLPRGVKLERRFLKTDPMQRIRDYLAIHFGDEGDITSNFSISTNYPKVEITDFSKTVQEMNLHPRGMLYVQDLDA